MDPDGRGLSDERYFLHRLFFPVSMDLSFSDRNLPLQAADGRQQYSFEAGFSSAGAVPEHDRPAFPADLSAASAAAVSAGQRSRMNRWTGPAAG